MTHTQLLAVRRRADSRGVANRLLRFLPLLVLLAVLFLLIILPLIFILIASFTDVSPASTNPAHFTWDNFLALFSPSVIQAMGNSAIIGLGGAFCSLVAGGLLAWLAARTNVPLKGIVQVVAISPLFISSLVGAIAWNYLASPNQGLLNILMRDLHLPTIFDAYTIPGLIFVFTIYYTPYAYLLIFNALSLSNPELEEAARVHGAPTWRVLTKVTFPLVLPAVLAASLLTFVLIIENFPIPQVLGTPASISTLPSYIYRLMNMVPVRANNAAAVGILLMVIVFLIVYVQRRILAKGRFQTVTGKGMRQKVTDLGPWRWVAGAFVMLYLVVSTVLPFLALILLSLRKSTFIGSITDLFDVSGYGLATYQYVLDYAPFVEGLKNSLIIGALTAVTGAILHAVMAFAVTRTKVPGRALVEYIAAIPLAVPGLVLGMGLLWAWTKSPVPIYGTIAVLIIAYVANNTPQGFQSISSSMTQIHKELEEAAMVSGATPFTTAMRVTVPLVRTSVFTAAITLMILCIRELSVAIFLFTADTRMLSIVTFDFYNSGSASRAAAVSVLYTALLAILVVATKRWLVPKKH